MKQCASILSLLLHTTLLLAGGAPIEEEACCCPSKLFSVPPVSPIRSSMHIRTLHSTLLMHRLNMVGILDRSGYLLDIAPNGHLEILARIVPRQPAENRPEERSAKRTRYDHSQMAAAAMPSSTPSQPPPLRPFFLTHGPITEQCEQEDPWPFASKLTSQHLEQTCHNALPPSSIQPHSLTMASLSSLFAMQYQESFVYYHEDKGIPVTPVEEQPCKPS